jgi:hypothetical protein
MKILKKTKTKIKLTNLYIIYITKTKTVLMFLKNNNQIILTLINNINKVFSCNKIINISQTIIKIFKLKMK